MRLPPRAVPIVLNSSTYSVFLSSNGNVAPELFKCLAPLKAGGRLAGVVALGRRPGDALYEDSELDALESAVQLHRAGGSESCADANHRAARL